MMEIKVVSAQEIESYIDIIANLRITIFKEYPYLYDGDYTYEQKYLKKFLETPDSLICVAYDENQIVGAITALPLKYEDELIKKPFLNQGISMDTVYYYSEALILQEYRKKGIGIKMFKMAEEKIISMGKYTFFTFAAIERNENHPQKPKDYQSPYPFFGKIGFQQRRDLVCQMSWKEIDQTQESIKSLYFWTKKK
ncbi:MAG: GNAT family N-acetyltransferase [Bacteroidales bacterium]|nr:GNAT family N-acetyltransferase [Bacteroidales bacterium]